MTEVIKVKNLSRSFTQYKKNPGFWGTIRGFFKREKFEVKAVNNVSFSIEEGERVGFIGPNGAGKTTTLKMLSGILYPSSGEVEVLGYKPINRDEEYLKQISLVMGQKSQLWLDLPAMEGFLLNKEIYEISDADFKFKINELSEILDLEKVLDIPVRKLSLGQRMKAELLSSLLHGPKILFLDEPTIGLDIVVQKRIRNFFKEYNKKYNTTLLLTSHYMDDVRELCERIIIISKGRIIFDDKIDNLILKYAHDKTLKIVFETIPNINEISKYGEVTKYDEQAKIAIIRVKRQIHTKVASDFLHKFKIEDIDIAEVELEEIIRNIFEAAEKNVK